MNDNNGDDNDKNRLKNAVKDIYHLLRSATALAASRDGVELPGVSSFPFCQLVDSLKIVGLNFLPPHVYSYVASNF